VGERTGALDTLLLRVADASDQEVDAAVARFTALLEPALILGLGLVVGGMIIAMYLPIFDMVGVMG
jgi:type IV pilus assembly protein PilC